MCLKEARKLAGLFILLLMAARTFAQQRPNIILILADDMGYGDLGCYGQRMIRTPYIDSLAAEGIRFTDYYAGCTVCAPSRESMLTGMTTGHTAIRGNFLTDQQEDPPMPEDKKTIAEYLKKAGYRTGLYGKWGLGGEDYGPETQGFDSSFCYLDQIRAHNYYPAYLYHNGDRTFIRGNGGGKHRTYSHDLFVRKTLDFIRNSRGDKPFFLYLPYTIPHGAYSLTPSPAYASKDWPAQFKVYATMISRLDSDVGEIVSLLRKKGLADHTVIFFTSDNGANLAFARFFKSNGPFRGNKRELYEGGIREPLIAWWPGTIKPGGVSHHIMAAWDFLPTLCELAHQKPPAGIDGISFYPSLTGRRQQDHRFLYWEYYQYNYNWYKKGDKLPRNYLKNRAVRYGEWKAVQNRLYQNKNAPIELYDLAIDTGEDHNVAFKHPEIIRKVRHFFAESTVADAPFFPYPPDTACRLHVLNIRSPEDMKDFFHYSAARLPFISSHRGGPALGYPENCLATFTHTIRHTWSILEVDPHYTKDSIIILMHDPTLDRTSTGHGKISDHTLAQLEELNLKDDQGHVTKYRIPTLDQALEWAKGRTVLILDQKDVSAAVRAQKIRDHHAETCAMVMCYSFADAKKCYQVDKNIMMEVFIPDRKHMDEFANSGVPWANVVAFVTHDTPKDPRIFQFLHDKGVMTIRGSSRNIDRAYQQGNISKKELQEGYRKMIKAGADIIESDLGVQAGHEIIKMCNTSGSRKKYFSESAL